VRARAVTGLELQIARCGLAAHVVSAGAKGCVVFSPEPVRDYRGFLEIDDRFYKKADDRWPVFVIFTSDGTEASTGSREKEFLKWSPLLGPRGVTVHAFVLKTPKGSGMPEIVAENLTQNTGGRYDVMNTSTALAEKMKALGEKLALDHRNMRNWYEVDIQTDSDVAPIDVAVAREGVRLQISNSRHGK